MRLVSVLVGTPRTVGTPHASDPMHRVFTSAIWKEPVAGPVWVGALGLRGDAVGNPRVHGGPDQAVLMYAVSHYSVWSAEWGREIGPGAFGENLSVDGLTEETACLGDVYDIGDARLEVTKPREPCATLARRHQMRNMIAIVQGNGRGGWYLRVLREGEVAAGQEMRLVHRPHPEWPVHAVARAMLERHADPGRAARLAGVEALAANWKQRLQARS